MTTRPQKHGLTPGRAMLMAVLAIGLGVVWGPQLVGMLGGGSSPSIASNRLSPPTSAPRQPPSAKRGSQPVGAVAAEKKLPKYTLEQASACDPFALQAWSPSAGQLAKTATSSPSSIDPVSDEENRFDAIRSRGVAMILVTDGGQAAQVGDRTLHVGDLIDGFEVVDINANGVIFRPAPNDVEGDDHGA